MAKFITHKGNKVNVSKKPTIIYQSKDGSTTVYGRPTPETKKLTTQNLLRGNDGRIIKTYDSGRTIVHSKSNPEISNAEVNARIVDIEKEIAEQKALKGSKKKRVTYRHPKFSYHDRTPKQFHWLDQLIPDTLYNEENAIQNKMSAKRATELVNILVKANNAKDIYEVLRTHSNGGFVNKAGMS